MILSIKEHCQNKDRLRGLIDGKIQDGAVLGGPTQACHHFGPQRALMGRLGKGVDDRFNLEQAFFGLVERVRDVRAKVGIGRDEMVKDRFKIGLAGQ